MGGYPRPGRCVGRSSHRISGGQSPFEPLRPHDDLRKGLVGDSAGATKEFPGAGARHHDPELLSLIRGPGVVEASIDLLDVAVPHRPDGDGTPPGGTVREQSFENHRSLVPGFHRVAAFLVFLPLVWFVYRAITQFSVDAVMLVSLTLGLILTGLYARVFALRVQDRVIRGEERARMARLFPPELAGRIDDLTTDQLVGLRFASDEELPDLTARVLRGEFADRTAIKGAIRNWRADNERI